MEIAHRQPPTFVVRPGLPSDAGFIARHWVDCYLDALPKPWTHRMDESQAKRFLHHHVAKILKRAEVRIAERPDTEAPPGDEWRYIYGAAVVEKPNTAHFVFVRPSWRKQGVATLLLQDMDMSRTTITTWTKEVSGFPDGWIANKYKGFKYVPFYMLDGDEERQAEAAKRNLL